MHWILDVDAHTPRLIFVGDIHGCARELEALLAAVRAAPEDLVISVGDLVAKGPASNDVLAIMQDLGAVAVRGNHDQAVLRALENPGDARLAETHRQTAAGLTADGRRYLENLPYSLRLPQAGIIVVHAGLVAGVPLVKQDPRDLMTMRTIAADGRASAKNDGAPWASLWQGPEEVVFGHDARRGVQHHRFAIGLDSGCVYGGALTAYVWPERRLVSVRAQRAYAPKGED